MNTRVIIPLFFISFQACTSVLPRGQESFDTERVESFSNIPQGIVDAFEIEHNNLEIDSVSCVSMPVAGSLTKGDISNAHIYLAYGKDRTCTVFSKINEDVDLIAIIDSTTLSVRHFGSGVLNFVEGEVSEDYSSFWVADYISAYVLNLCNERSLCKSAVLYANETWITDEKIGPLMRTVWHQNSPFNDVLNSVYNVGNYAAGCGPVALGQICAYNGFPSSIDGVTIGWSGVRTVYSYDEYGVFNTGTSYSGEASYVVYKCGEIGDADFGTSTSLPIAGAKHVLESFGYTNVRKHSWANVGNDMYYYIKNHLRRNLPAYFQGTRTSGIIPVSGHAWVLDGLWRMHTASGSRTLYHVNFGWGGTHNGWYKEGMFGASEDMIYYNSLVGDSYAPGHPSYGYDYHLANQALTYSIPQ